MELDIPGLSRTLSLIEFVPKEASEELWEAYFALSESIFREFNEGDRLPDRSTMRRFISTSNPLYQVKRWLLFDSAEAAIASAWISYDTESSPDYESNRHLGQVRISVVPAYRRKKIAARLLQRLNETASLMGKDLLMAEVDNSLAEGFCTRLQGELVLEEIKHRLRLDDVDWQLVEQWLEKGKTKTRDIEIELFQECPEGDIEEFTRVYTEIINQRPTGDMKRALNTTPESRRVEERNLRRGGIEWHTMISREASGHISGVTDIMYNPEEPHRVNQYFTGVLAKYRRRGLAKRLKAEMLVAIKRMFPDVEFVTTTTARSNRPMRSVNKQLGFLPHRTVFIYQWAVQDLARRVDEVLSGLGPSSKAR